MNSNASDLHQAERIQYQ